MEAKFGPLTAKVKQQVEDLSSNALAQLQLDLLNAQSLEELRLDDEACWFFQSKKPREKSAPPLTRVAGRRT